MNNSPHRLAYVVPTKDRPDDLRVLLASLAAQTEMPHQIVIVDGSNPDISSVCKEFPKLPITYVRCFPPSLSKQRNAGMAALADGIDLAGYLDDDLELDADATERMLQFWRNASEDTGGAALSIRNQPQLQHSRLLQFFGITGKQIGRMLPSAHPVAIPYVENTTETEWLYGGATIWRRKVVEEFLYDEWYEGHGYMEDIDYSYRVSRKYRLFVVGEARCMHYSRPISDARQRDFGRQQIYNRVYFARKMKQFSLPHVAWAIFGTFAINLGALMRHLDKPRWDRVLGNISAFRLLIRGTTGPVAGYWK